MRTKIFFTGLLLSVTLFNLSCKKDNAALLNKESETANALAKQKKKCLLPFDLNVKLYSKCKSKGYLKFRQNADAAKIIDLDIEVKYLQPNHNYLLQRAVDAVNVVDGNCTSVAWLTLGNGLTPQSILTDNKGNGEQHLWRDVTAIPSGSMFDIHFLVIDAITLKVVLSSDCYQYQVR